MKRRFLNSISFVFMSLCLIACSIAQAAEAQSPQLLLSPQLTYGTYTGTLQMDGRAEILATTLDAYIVQDKAPGTYPKLNLILRVSLGGYQSSEYVAYQFEKPTYDFESGTLQLNDPHNDLTASLKVSNSDSQTLLQGMQGTVLFRPTNTKGTLRLAITTDTLSAVTNLPGIGLPFVSELNGEYQGSCGQQHGAQLSAQLSAQLPEQSPVKLQIETGRDLGSAIPGNALNGYLISGRLGEKNSALCAGSDAQAHYCNVNPFTLGSYSIYDGRLTFRGQLSNLDCNRTLDQLDCIFHGQQGKKTCVLKKLKSSTSPPAQFPATAFLDVPTELMKPLPTPLPPKNEALLSALNGDYYGLLHYENRDIYQLMQMSIVASTSTDNMHVQNQVLISPTISLRLGSSWLTPPALSVLLDDRIFYLNPGFSLNSEDSDYFAVIGDWRAAYVSGVWYSRSFGRVGTFELQKTQVPNLPPNISIIPQLTGRFRGPNDAPTPLKDVWTLDIDAPNQTPLPHQRSVQLLARYQLQSAIGVMQLFDGANLDLNTGTLNFSIRNPAGDRIVKGSLLDENHITLLWPLGPTFASLMEPYLTYSYNRLSETRLLENRHDL